jgi:hypothetical protein
MSGTIKWSQGLPEVFGPDGVRVDATTDWVSLVKESVLPAYNQLVVDLLEIAEGQSRVLYWDNADPPRPTIGIGANLQRDGNTLDTHIPGARRARHWTERRHVPVIGVSRSAHCRNYGGRLVADRRESTRLESAGKGFQAVGLNRDEGMSEVVAVLTSLR